VQLSRSRASARFIFISDGRATSSWRDAQPMTSGRVAWRVLAANNRPLGRSAQAFGSFEDARQDATRMQAALDELVPTISLGDAVGHWTWQLAMRAQAVACCVHEYQRRIECARSLEQFVAAVRTADPVAGELRNFGSNALKAYGERLQSVGGTRLRLAIR
jgi:hypothetical protein